MTKHANAEEIAYLGGDDNSEPHDSNPQSARDTAMKLLDEAKDKATEGAPAEAQGELPVTEPTPSPAEATEAGGEPAQGVPPLSPPADWSADDQAVFHKMDAETQKWAIAHDTARREAQAAQMAALSPWQQLDTTWDPYFTRLGVPKAQAVDRLLQADMTLRTGTPQQKQAMVNSILDTYGLREVISPQPAQQVPEDIAQDPVLSGMNQDFNNRLNQVMQAVEGMQSQISSQFGSMQQQQIANDAAALQAWSSATDEKGAPLRPYYAEVEGLMSALAQHAKTTGVQTSLDEVYAQACAAHPEVSRKIKQSQEAAALVQRQQEAASKQAASKSVSGSPGVQRQSNESLSAQPGETATETARRIAASLRASDA